MPNDDELVFDADGKPIRAIMPPSDGSKCEASSSNSNYAVHYIQPEQRQRVLNDFAIDITHIEKFVQDTDVIILDQK